jgi:hypothetical protein
MEGKRTESELLKRVRERYRELYHEEMPEDLTAEDVYKALEKVEWVTITVPETEEEWKRAEEELDFYHRHGRWPSPSELSAPA